MNELMKMAGARLNTAYLHRGSNGSTHPFPNPHHPELNINLQTSLKSLADGDS